jgi:hypothetical protein
MATSPDLQRVREAAAEATRGRERLVVEIRNVRAAGASLRAIAEAARLAPETIRKLAA